MKKHEILSPQSRAALFDPPTDPAEIVRHYTPSRRHHDAVLHKPAVHRSRPGDQPVGRQYKRGYG